MYSVVYPNSTVTQLSRFYLEARKMLINGEEHTSEKSRSERSSIIAAHWPGVLGIDSRGEAEFRAGSITLHASSNTRLQLMIVIIKVLFLLPTT